VSECTAAILLLIIVIYHMIHAQRIRLLLHLLNEHCKILELYKKAAEQGLVEIKKWQRSNEQKGGKHEAHITQGD
jgi:hypothetical protein